MPFKVRGSANYVSFSGDCCLNMDEDRPPTLSVVNSLCTSNITPLTIKMPNLRYCTPIIARKTLLKTPVNKNTPILMIQTTILILDPNRTN